MSEYQDRWIQCTPNEIRVRAYYFPWGTKRIPYGSIRALDRFTMTPRRGKGRIWGSGDFEHWANLDPQRPSKSVGFFLDVGRRVVPLLTPDDPDAFEVAVREHADPGPDPNPAGSQGERQSRSNEPPPTRTGWAMSSWPTAWAARSASSLIATQRRPSAVSHRTTVRTGSISA